MPDGVSNRSPLPKIPDQNPQAPAKQEEEMKSGSSRGRSISGSPSRVKQTLITQQTKVTANVTAPVFNKGTSSPNTPPQRPLSSTKAYVEQRRLSQKFTQRSPSFSKPEPLEAPPVETPPVPIPPRPQIRQNANRPHAQPNAYVANRNSPPVQQNANQPNAPRPRALPTPNIPQSRANPPTQPLPTPPVQPNAGRIPPRPTIPQSRTNPPTQPLPNPPVQPNAGRIPPRPTMPQSRTNPPTQPLPNPPVQPNANQLNTGPIQVPPRPRPYIPQSENPPAQPNASVSPQTTKATSQELPVPPQNEPTTSPLTSKSQTDPQVKKQGLFANISRVFTKNVTPSSKSDQTDTKLVALEQKTQSQLAKLSQNNPKGNLKELKNLFKSREEISEALKNGNGNPETLKKLNQLEKTLSTIKAATEGIKKRDQYTAAVKAATDVKAAEAKAADDEIAAAEAKAAAPAKAKQAMNEQALSENVLAALDRSKNAPPPVQTDPTKPPPMTADQFYLKTFDEIVSTEQSYKENISSMAKAEYTLEDGSQGTIFDLLFEKKLISSKEQQELNQATKGLVEASTQFIQRMTFNTNGMSKEEIREKKIRLSIQEFNPERLAEMADKLGEFKKIFLDIQPKLNQAYDKKATNTPFTEFTDKNQNNDLFSKLIQPIQRMPRYVLFSREFDKHVSAANEPLDPKTKKTTPPLDQTLADSYTSQYSRTNRFNDQGLAFNRI